MPLPSDKLARPSDTSSYRTPLTLIGFGCTPKLRALLVEGVALRKAESECLAKAESPARRKKRDR